MSLRLPGPLGRPLAAYFNINHPHGALLKRWVIVVPGISITFLHLHSCQPSPLWHVQHMNMHTSALPPNASCHICVTERGLQVKGEDPMMMYPAAEVLFSASSPGTTSTAAAAAAAAAAALGSPRTPRASSGRASPQAGGPGWADATIMRKPSSSAGSILAVRSSGSFLVEGGTISKLGLALHTMGIQLGMCSS
jgi:hypothetical protein